MKNTKLAGGLFILYFLIVIGFLLWKWYRFGEDRDPSDYGGVVLLVIFAFILYYYALTVWAWRLTMRTYEHPNRPGFQFVVLFLVGILPSLVWLSFQVFQN